MSNPVYQNKAWTYDNIIQYANIDTDNLVQEKTELIKCDTTNGPVDIYLLPIGDYWDYEYKLYVTDSEGSGGTNNITIHAPDLHLINGQTGVTIINDYGSALIRVVDSTNYIAQFGKPDGFFNSITTSAFTLNGVTLTSLSALTGMDVEFFGEKTIYYSDQLTSSPYLDDPNNLYDRNKPKTPSISAVTAGGTPPYTYNWSIVEGPFAGHRFHSSFDYSATTGDSVYLQVNYNYKPLGPRVSNTLNAMDGSTKASTTLKLVTTDSNGFKNTSYYTYTVTDCYPIMDLNFCLTNNENGPDGVEYYDIGKSYFNWVLPAIGFLDDERTVPTCTDLDNLGCENGDIESIMLGNRIRINLYIKNQSENIIKLTTKGIFFKDGIIDFNKSPYYSNNEQFFLNFNQLTNTLESKKDLFFTNNGKVPLSNIKVFGPGINFTKITDDNSTEGNILWETVASTDSPLAGETLAEYFPNVTDLFYRQAVKTESDLPTLNDVIPPDNNQMIYVIDTSETWIWDDGTYSSNAGWVNASNIGVFNDILTNRIATASAQNKATYEWYLSQTPFLWANIYLPLHIAKKRFI